MTIALAIKIGDGLVLAADSATTFSSPLQDSGKQETLNVFNNGEKITNLHRNLPLGLMTWGLASLKGHSINWHAKEIRRRFEGEDALHPDWALNDVDYQIIQIAERVFEYFESILPKVDEIGVFSFGLLICGYGSQSSDAEVFTIQTVNSILSKPALSIRQDQSGVVWFGQPEALVRLVTGTSQKMASALLEAGLEAEKIPQYIDVILKQTNATLVWHNMPLQDAIDLANFLADTAIKFTQYIPGPNSVGGPIDVATITRHEDFKWVKRKHFYPIELNPREAKND